MSHDPRFDTIIDRRGTHSTKWDMMEPLYGVSPDEGLSMWVADMDFKPPQCVQDAVQSYQEHGVFGYFGDYSDYKSAIQWWMWNRHGWDVDHEEIFTTHGLVNGTAMCVETFTEPGDAVILFTPVYHAFARVLKAAGREIRECELTLNNGRYEMDFGAYEDQMTGREKMLILCSPHNPGGRVWTKTELDTLAEFSRKHDLIIVSDEIHHDLVMPGHRHIPMTAIEGITDRLIMMTASTKTFNTAGCHTGNVMISDPKMRDVFNNRMMGLGLSPNSFGLHMATAAYSPDGASWVDDLCRYLNENRALFDSGINAIPGLKSMNLEATYLSWIDFSGTGMETAEFTSRVQNQAKIAVNLGPTFGAGGEDYLRFNIAMPRAQVQEAVSRMTEAFSDLQ